MTYALKSSTQNTIENAQLRHSLEQSSIFGDLDAQLISNLVNTLTVEIISGGEELYCQGDTSDTLLVVVSGRLLALRQMPDGSTVRLGEIGPGCTVGEIGLILQQPRAADIVAIRDSSVARLSRNQFEQLLILHPVQLNRAISRTIYQYSNHNGGRPVSLGATTFAVIPLDDKIDTCQLCIQLKEALSQHGRVHHLTSTDGEQFHTDIGASAQSNERINDLEQRFDFIIYQATSQSCPWSHLAARQADQLILVANADSPVKPGKLIDSIAPLRGFNMVRKSLVLLHPSCAKTPTIDAGWQQTFDLERVYPIRTGHLSDIQRLVRFITDKAVGLVLGGGGARGLAHIGVLKALHESNIPIDMVCGNSMGALIGAQYVNGTDIDELLDTTKRFIRGGERPTFPLFSLLSGARVRRDLQRMFVDIQIENLWRLFSLSLVISAAHV